MTIEQTGRYRVVSSVYRGGGVHSWHRTLTGARRAIQKHDATIRKLRTSHPDYYHDCKIEERAEAGIQLWHPVYGETADAR